MCLPVYDVELWFSACDGGDRFLSATRQREHKPRQNQQGAVELPVHLLALPGPGAADFAVLFHYLVIQSKARRLLLRDILHNQRVFGFDHLLFSSLHSEQKHNHV